MNTKRQEATRSIFEKCAAMLPPLDKPTVYHAVFSPSAALEYGSSIYLSADGETEVEVTCVDENPEWVKKNYLWPDARPVGTVTKWLRKSFPDTSISWLDTVDRYTHLPVKKP